jgi:hypothetical protein
MASLFTKKSKSTVHAAKLKSTQAEKDAAIALQQQKGFLSQLKKQNTEVHHSSVARLFASQTHAKRKPHHKTDTKKTNS